MCKARAATPEAGENFIRIFQAYQDDVIEAHKTSDLSDSQPTKGNIEGGLSTIEEKALGNLEKIGRDVQYLDAVGPAVPPTKGRACISWTARRPPPNASRSWPPQALRSIHSPTGQGNIIGHPIVPVIKLTANPRTVRTMGEHIDVDVSGLLRRELTMDQSGDALIDMVIRTANGRATAAEALGHREFVMTKLYRSA